MYTKFTRRPPNVRSHQRAHPVDLCEARRFRARLRGLRCYAAPASAPDQVLRCLVLSGPK